ncbi:MAG: hypothetical protein HYV39_04020 [Candidatus Levybacteria bacterium]|nr:hypothetical protein [Candidatus Levybacteria bacterium]
MVLPKEIFTSFIIFFLAVSFFGDIVFAQTPTLTPTPTPDTSKQEQDLQNKINELQGKIKELQGQQRTLSSQISVMDNQIQLTELRINATKQQIIGITGDIKTATKKIESLEEALEKLTKVLINRIVETYEVGSIQPFYILLSTTSATDFISKLNYLKIVQENDKKLIFATQQAKNDYVTQKNIFEDKKKKVESLKTQLEGYTAQLASEKQAKQTLLEITKNDEKRYQDLLARARAEFEAIKGIIAGRGQETEIGAVSEGQTIASVIAGSSCNSGGEHLHFIVSRSGTTENPFNYLKGADYENCSGSSCGSGDGDPFNPSGGWNWPIDPKVKLTQGYGNTWATLYNPIVRQIYNFHNGIDIMGSSYSVKAVQSGTLYQGSYTGLNGCRLRYVRVRHKDSDLDTFYLHVNYNS